jgi:hypothetical protein
MKIGDVTLGITGDKSGWTSTLSQVESDSGQSATSISQKFRDALSPANILSGVAIGAGIAIFDELKNVFSDLTNIIPNLVEKGEAYALSVNDIMVRTGATAEASSNLAATLTFLGIPVDNLGQTLSMLAKNVDTNAARFNALGIATRDSNGQLLSGVDILNNIREKYQDLSDGEQKVVLAQELISRGGGSLLEYLNLSNAQVAQLQQQWQSLGLILDANGVQKAKDVEREQALLGLALTGLGNTIFQAVAPAVTTLTDTFVQLVEKYGPEIKDFFTSAAGWVMGLVQALTGFDLSGADTFMASFDSNVAAVGTDTATTTGAITANTKALDEENTKLTAQDTALQKVATDEERLFQAKMKTLSASVQSQITAIDNAQQAAQQAQQHQTDLQNLTSAQQALTDAEIKYQEAQQAAAASPAKTSASDTLRSAAQAVLDAEQRVANAQQTITDNAVKDQQDALKTRLQADKDYVDSIAQLEASSTDKSSLVHTLAARAKVLASRLAADQEKGDAQSVSDDKIRLEAVTTAEAQAKSAARIVTQQDEIAKAKAAIADEKQALEDLATGGTDAGNAISAGMDKADTSMGKATTGITGSGGLVGALDSGKAAGAAFASALKSDFATVEAALKPLLDGLGWIVSNLGQIALAWAFVTDPKFQAQVGGTGPEGAGLAQVVQVATTGLGNLTGLAGLQALIDLLTTGNVQGKAAARSTAPTARASGGPILPGGAYRINEGTPFEGLYSPSYPQVVVPALSMPSLAAGGADAGTLIVERLTLEVEGNRLVDYVNEKLAYRRLRHT